MSDTVKPLFSEHRLGADLLRQLVQANFDTGSMIWRPRPRAMFGSDFHYEGWNSRWAGRPCLLSGKGRGYYSGCINRVQVQAHRVIWAMHYGVCADQGIDHIDGNGRNNAITNLRLASHLENMRNCKVRSDSTSGVPGLTFRNGKWEVKITVHSKTIWIGSYWDRAKAIAVRKAAEVKHNFHPNHGART